jgi:hypothetical protein
MLAIHFRRVALCLASVINLEDRFAILLIIPTAQTIDFAQLAGDNSKTLLKVIPSNVDLTLAVSFQKRL